MNCPLLFNLQFHLFTLLKSTLRYSIYRFNMLLSSFDIQSAQAYAPGAFGLLALGYFLWTFVLSPESPYKSHRLGESRLVSFLTGRKSIRWYIDEIVETGYVQVGGGDQIPAGDLV